MGSLEWTLRGASVQFVVEQVSDGQFYWVLKASNGKVICASEKVDDRAECLEAISAIQVGVRQAVIIDNTLPATS